MSKPSKNPKRIRISIINPAPGGSPYTSLSRARRFKFKGLGDFTEFGNFFFYRDGDEHFCQPKSPNLPQVVIEVKDAFPGWPVLPNWQSVERLKLQKKY